MQLDDEYVHHWRCTNNSSSTNMLFCFGETEGIVDGPAIAAEVCGVARHGQGTHQDCAVTNGKGATVKHCMHVAVITQPRNVS